MKAFLPIDITDARFVSSTIAEPDAAEPAWNSGTTYAQDAEVSVITTDSHLVYKSLVSSNLNNPPATSPDKWFLKGYTNRFRMFDWNQGNPSKGASPLTVTIKPGQRINAVMLEGIKAATAAITVKDGVSGPTVLTINKDLLNRHATTPYEWCFSPFVYDKVTATFDVPPVGDPVVTITLTDPSGTCELSRFAVGQAILLGDIEWNPVSDAENYSEITWDAFGKATLTPVPSQPIIELELATEANRVNTVKQFRDQANAKAVVWSGLDNLDHVYAESLVLIGVYQRFPIDLSNIKQAKINLTLKGI
ncbi:hypothetical protein [Nitrosomonas communis]|uniref:hypothetical protein n=1 Tax=Nitrosomonas communis TaxID=44574 RepID=UPI003D2E1DA8